MLSVPEHDIPNIPDAQSVYEDRACVHLVHNLRGVLIHLQHISGLDDEYIFLRDAEGLRHFRVGFQVTVLAVHRNRVFRLYKRIDEFQLFLTGMSGYVGILEDDFRALCRKLVYHAGNRFLISRNGVGAEDDGVVRLDGHLAVYVRRHPGERRHGLSLAAGGDEHHFLRRIILHLVNLNQCVFRDIEIAKLGGRGDDIYHAPPLHNDFPSIFVSRIDNLLHAVHIGGKGRDDEPCILMLRKDMVKCDAHRALRLRKSAALGIRTVGHQREYALLSDFRKPLKVDGVSEHRRIVHLEVSCVDDHARRGIDCQCRRILDAVVRLDELDAEFPQIDGLSVLHDFPSRAAQQVVLL